MLVSIKMINSKTLQHKWLIHQSTTTKCSGSMPTCIQTLLNIMLLTCWRQTYSRYYIYRSPKWSCIHTFFSPQVSQEFFVVFSKCQIADLVITEKRGKKWWILCTTTHGFQNDQTKRWQAIVTMTMSVSVSMNGLRWKKYWMILLKGPTLVILHTFHLKVKNHSLFVTSMSEKVKTAEGYLLQKQENIAALLWNNSCLVSS